MKISFSFWMLMGFLPLTGFSQLPEKAEDAVPLKVGEVVPSLVLTSVSGESVPLTKIFKEKPTILIFYRGGWCPYCNQHLAEMASYEEAILEMGYQIVAVSPDSPENLGKTMDKDEINYTLLSDSRGELIKAMGIAYQATFLYESIRSKGATGEKLDLLPVPSLFVLDQNGVIQYEHVDPDYKVRMSGEELMNILRHLKP